MQKTFGKKLGRNIFFEGNISPHEIFALFLTDEETKKMSLESRSYARLKGEQYFTTTLGKLKAFIPIILVGGYTELQRQEIHWERREDGYNLFVSSMMGKNDFEECKKYLHFSDNNNLDMVDQLAKVRPQFNSFNQHCLLNYQPAQHISVDESMVLYFGGHGTSQHIHGKPIEFWFKLWVMATPLGYCTNFVHILVKTPFCKCILTFF